MDSLTLDLLYAVPLDQLVPEEIVGGGGGGGGGGATPTEGTINEKDAAAAVENDDQGEEVPRYDVTRVLARGCFSADVAGQHATQQRVVTYLLCTPRTPWEQAHAHHMLDECPALRSLLKAVRRAGGDGGAAEEEEEEEEEESSTRPPYMPDIVFWAVYFFLARSLLQDARDLPDDVDEPVTRVRTGTGTGTCPPPVIVMTNEEEKETEKRKSGTEAGMPSSSSSSSISMSIIPPGGDTQPDPNPDPDHHATSTTSFPLRWSSSWVEGWTEGLTQAVTQVAEKVQMAERDFMESSAGAAVRDLTTKVGVTTRHVASQVLDGAKAVGGDLQDAGRDAAGAYREVITMLVPPKDHQGRQDHPVGAEGPVDVGVGDDFGYQKHRGQAGGDLLRFEDSDEEELAHEVERMRLQAESGGNEDKSAREEDRSSPAPLPLQDQEDPPPPN